MQTGMDDETEVEFTEGLADIDGPDLGEYLRGRYNESPKPKSRKSAAPYFEGSPTPISQKAFDTLTRIRHLYDKAVLTTPEAMRVENAMQFICEAGRRDELTRLETGVWYVIKNVEFDTGPRIVLGLLILTTEGRVAGNEYVLDIIGCVEHGVFPAMKSVNPNYHIVEERELPAFLQHLPQGVKTKIQQRTRGSEVRLLLL